MSPDTRTWLNLGRELGIREIVALDEENRQSAWMRVDAIRGRALEATNSEYRERWTRATKHVSRMLAVTPR